MLTDTKCKTATYFPDKKREEFIDAAGPYLQVSSAAAKCWLWKFCPDGKECRLVLGSYPETTLNAARLAPDEALKTRHAGANPAHKRKADNPGADLHEGEAIACGAARRRDIGW